MQFLELSKLAPVYKFEIRNGVIEVEWKAPVFEMKYEGDDTWDTDENHNVCGLKLYLTVNEETGSIIRTEKPEVFNFLKDELPKIDLSLDSFNSESLRQEVFQDNIVFIYKEPLFPLEYFVLYPGVYLLRNHDKTMHSIVFTNLFDYSFFGSFPSIPPIKLNSFPEELRVKFWKFCLLNWIYFGSENYLTEFISLGSYLKAVASPLPVHWKNYIGERIDDWSSLSK